MNKNLLITNSIPYVNASPHVGHALEFIQSDTIARYYRLLENKVLLLCGSDENAIKNVQAADKSKINLQKFIDEHAKEFQQLAESLNVKFDIFQKGSDQKHHFISSQRLWRLCNENDDIYKKDYEGLYCVGCETFYTKEELGENGECHEHPGRQLEKVIETNYFFRLSKYQNKLIDLIQSDSLKIYPEKRKNEVLGFLKQPLRDISISRLNERARNWGVPVPNDSTQKIYVWFDALNIYQSGIGFGWDDKLYKEWWPAKIHVIGKGIVRFHAVYWPAFLLSAKLKLPQSLFVHDYLTVNGQKMSKTIGNIIDPFSLIKKYGTDAVRYYFLREISPYSDGDYSEKRMNEVYSSDLANELGNLLSRITTLAQKDNLSIDKTNLVISQIYPKNLKKHFDNYEFNLVLESIWTNIRSLNKEINDFTPWSKQANERKTFLISQVQTLNLIGHQLLPFLPETAAKIIKATCGKIKKIQPLFPRLS